MDMSDDNCVITIKGSVQISSVMYPF